MFSQYIIYLPEEVKSIASLIKGNSGESLFVIYSTHDVGKEILCQTMMLTISVKFLIFLMERLNLGPTSLLT
jgi:hypothetical protein